MTRPPLWMEGDRNPIVYRSGYILLSIPDDKILLLKWFRCYTTLLVGRLLDIWEAKCKGGGHYEGVPPIFLCRTLHSTPSSSDGFRVRYVSCREKWIGFSTLAASKKADGASFVRFVSVSGFRNVDVISAGCRWQQPFAPGLLRSKHRRTDRQKRERCTFQ